MDSGIHINPDFSRHRATSEKHLGQQLGPFSLQKTGQDAQGPSAETPVPPPLHRPLKAMLQPLEGRRNAALFGDPAAPVGEVAAARL